MKKILSILAILMFFYTLLSAYTLEKISLQLKWKHSFQFAGFYIAKEKGFYSDVGLDVEIKEKKDNLNNTKIHDNIINSKSTYGISNSSIIYDVMKNRPLIALMPIFQHSALVLVTTDKNITKLKDLENKKIKISDSNKKSATIPTAPNSDKKIDLNVPSVPKSENKKEETK